MVYALNLLSNCYSKNNWTSNLANQHIVLFSQQVDIMDFVDKFLVWVRTGYEELGDKGGMGIGATTNKVVRHPDFKTDPHKVSIYIYFAFSPVL